MKWHAKRFRESNNPLLWLTQPRPLCVELSDRPHSSREPLYELWRDGWRWGWPFDSELFWLWRTNKNKVIIMGVKEKWEDGRFGRWVWRGPAVASPIDRKFVLATSAHRGRHIFSAYSGTVKSVLDSKLEHQSLPNMTSSDQLEGAIDSCWSITVEGQKFSSKDSIVIRS